MDLYELRERALRLAQEAETKVIESTPKAVLERARQYFEFLKGEGA